MAFYLRPPLGLAHLMEFQKTCRQRIKCYEHLCSEDEDTKNEILKLECLIEGSRFDRMGHFLFRFATLGKENNFRRSFIVNEVKLLELRLKDRNQVDTEILIKLLKEHSRECLKIAVKGGKVEKLYILLEQVSTQMLQIGYFEHAYTEHSEKCQECDKFQIKVPFDLCSNLVVTRQYELNKGYLHIYPYQWKCLIASLFEEYLQESLHEMNYLQLVKDAIDDPRIKGIIRLIGRLFSKSTANRLGVKKGKFALENIDQETQMFPLCMQNLFNILKKNNRLGHNARISCTTFMKDIGFSLDDNLAFWENTYSKEHSSCSSCTHNWQDHEKRFIYGIRHVYGLEGARKEYGVHSCHQVQESTLGTNEEGGCPFRHFGDSNLREILTDHLKPDQIEVIIHERQNNPTKACKMVFAEQLKNTFEGKDIDQVEIPFQNPAEYYFLMKKESDECL